MTGPEHYRRAGQLLDAADAALPPGQTRTDVIAAAAVHAQLAHTAVLALAAQPGAPGALPMLDYQAWDATAGVQEHEHDDESGGPAGAG